MKPLGITQDRLNFVIRFVLLLAGLSTYLIDPDDVVWRFIKTSPQPRLLEHILFGTAAAILGLSLLLEVNASSPRGSLDARSTHLYRKALTSLLQAIGIGSLLPLPGFLLLVIGNTAAPLLLHRRGMLAGGASSALDTNRTPRPLRVPEPDSLSDKRWRTFLSRYIGMCCAFFSMVIFSIVLIDRVADVLFAITALVSVAVGIRRDGAR
jgi:hypothetical protein